MSEERKVQCVREVLGIFDEDGDGVVSRAEWMRVWGQGKRLPDFGVCMSAGLFLLRDRR